MKKVELTINFEEINKTKLEDFAVALAAVSHHDTPDGDFIDTYTFTKSERCQLIAENIRKYGRIRRHPVYDVYVDVLTGDIYKFNPQKGMYIYKKTKGDLKERYEYIKVKDEYGKRKKEYIHHLVLEAFLGVVIHNKKKRRSYHTHHCGYDFNTNSIYNLRVCDAGENCRVRHDDAIEHGNNQRKFNYYVAKKKGSAKYMAKTQKELAELIGCSQRSISYAVSKNYEIYKHCNGFRVYGVREDEE